MVRQAHHDIMFPFQRFEIHGGSMYPAFKAGDHILVYCWGNIKLGDTVVFYKNGLKMVKRAIQKIGDHWQMRGDNYSHSTDSLDFGIVDVSQVIGKVVGKY